MRKDALLLKFRSHYTFEIMNFWGFGDVNIIGTIYISIFILQKLSVASEANYQKTDFSLNGD